MKKSICSIDANFKDVLIAINEEPIGIAFVVDESTRLCGVISDGDIRRLLINGLDINTKLQKHHLNKEFVFGRQGDDFEDLLKKTDRKIRVVPIVNDEFQPISYFKYEHTTNFTPVAEPHLKGKEFDYLIDAFMSTWIASKGRYIDRFEKDFSDFCGVQHGVAVSNGTVAIHLALEALDIGAGDEVIVPDLTFAATINAVLHAGATPVIVDVEKDYWTICPEEIKKAITPRTKAIIPVHLYGQPCDMEAISRIAKEHRLYVIEDCAEAHGASFNGKVVGSLSDISCFSFFANKIVTTGEGGMCLTQSPELAEKLRILRDHGMSRTQKYWHTHVGYNYRMTNLAAAIGCAQVERIQELIAKKQNLEVLYQQRLQDKMTFQRTDDSRRKKVVWMVSCLTSNRDEVLKKLSSANIEARPFFYPLSIMDLYKEFSRGTNENALAISKLGINLPSSPGLSEEDVLRVCEVC